MGSTTDKSQPLWPTLAGRPGLIEQPVGTNRPPRQLEIPAPCLIHARAWSISSPRRGRETPSMPFGRCPRGSGQEGGPSHELRRRLVLCALGLLARAHIDTETGCLWRTPRLPASGPCLTDVYEAGPAHSWSEPLQHRRRRSSLSSAPLANPSAISGRESRFVHHGDRRLPLRAREPLIDLEGKTAVIAAPAG
jgi:hypothetical protein